MAACSSSGPSFNLSCSWFHAKTLEGSNTLAPHTTPPSSAACLAAADSRSATDRSLMIGSNTSGNGAIDPASSDPAQSRPLPYWELLTSSIATYIQLAHFTAATHTLLRQYTLYCGNTRFTAAVCDVCFPKQFYHDCSAPIWHSNPESNLDYNLREERCCLAVLR